MLGSLFFVPSCASRKKRRRVSSPEQDFEFEDVLQSELPISIEIRRKISGGLPSKFLVPPNPFGSYSKEEKNLNRSTCVSSLGRSLRTSQTTFAPPSESCSLWNIGTSVLEEAWIDQALDDVDTTSDRELVKNILDLFRLLDSEPAGSMFRDSVIATISQELVDLGDEELLGAGMRTLLKTFECLTMGKRRTEFFKAVLSKALCTRKDARIISARWASAAKKKLNQQLN
mmetsp:Transcript_39396/g.76544  ORF Transcript_39396/g.76544 Transcript_39396/m.76544 type:complete len:229 (+) Transcript_39396:90-776(+)